MTGGLPRPDGQGMDRAGAGRSRRQHAGFDDGVREQLGGRGGGPASRGDAAVSEIFREIDEELRRDNIAKLWQRYGAYIVGAGVLIVFIVAAVVGWRSYQLKQRLAESVRYAAAAELVQQRDLAKAADAFTALAQQSAAGQAVVARLQAAALRAESGDTATAVAAWKSLAQDSSVDGIYRDLARLLAALHELGSADPKSLIADVAPLVQPGNPWRFSALEVTALAQLRAGDRAAALENYKKLADDLEAPPGLRARAAEMSAALAD
jgi:hypothetical protein